MRKSATYLLPGLSDSSITIYDRLDNIDRLNKFRASKGNLKNINFLTDEIFIENLRAFMMMLVLNIIPSNIDNVRFKELCDWYQRYSPMGSIPDTLVDTLCLNFVTTEFTNHVIDLIKYYNQNVKLLNTNLKNSTEKLYNDSYDFYNEQHFVYFTKTSINDKQIPEYKVIDIDYLYGLINAEVYEIQRGYVFGVHYLIDAMYPGIPIVNPSTYYNNQPLMVNGVKNNVTIEERMEYLQTLINNIESCPLRFIEHLRDSIFIEKLRIFLLYHYTKPKRTEEMIGVRNYIITHHQDIRNDPGYIINYYMKYKLPEYTFSDVIDFMYYFNTKKKYHITPEYLEETTFKYYDNPSSYPLYNYLKGQFRIDTINNIINI